MMSTIRSKMTVLAAALSVALLLVACGGGDGDTPQLGEDGELVSVRYSEVIRSIFYAPAYIAISEGFFEDEGLDVDMSTAQGSDRATAALIGGQADIALVGPETTIFLHNNPEGDTRIKTFAQLTNTDGSFLLSHEDPADFTWEQTRGTTIIGWRPGSMPQMVLDFVLDEHGVAGDVEVLSNIDIPAAPGAFISGQGDFITLFEPTVSSLAREGKHVVLAMGDEIGQIPYTVFTATEEFIDGNPEIVQAWTNAIYRAQLWAAQATPRELAEAVAPFFEEADMDDLESAMARYQELEAWLPQPLPPPEGIETLQDVMVHGGVLESDDRVDYDAIVETRFAEQAISNIEE